MEMSCDEAVIRKIDGDVRADYSASLLSLATGRRIIAGTPLAFGEGDTKGRINNLSKWKKPAVWVVLLAVAACVILSISLLTNPAAEREFPINGNNVSELDTEMVVEKIAKAEELENSSQLLSMRITLTSCLPRTSTGPMMERFAFIWTESEILQCAVENVS